MEASSAWTSDLCSDLVVLELASVLAGPSVGQFFAELGARVIKLENPATSGDVTRSWKVSGESEEGQSSYFYACNWGKESIAIDLTTDSGRNLMHRLVGISDIVLSNYLPSASEKLCADYETLKGIKEDIILGSIVGYRPDSNRPGYDAIIQAEAGYYYINGEPKNPNWQPTKMPVPLMDILAGHQLKQALLMALIRKSASQKGSHVTVSLFDAAVSALSNQATILLVANQTPEPLGSAHPNIAPYGSVYQTKDDLPVVLGVGTDRQFRSLCAILDTPELANDARFLSNQHRVANRGDLKGLLQSAITNFDRKELLKECHASRIPAGAVSKMNEVFEITPEYLTLKSPDGVARGVRESAIWPTEVRNDGGEIGKPPVFASSTVDILESDLELSSEEVQALLSEGVIAV